MRGCGSASGFNEVQARGEDVGPRVKRKPTDPRASLLVRGRSVRGRRVRVDAVGTTTNKPCYTRWHYCIQSTIHLQAHDENLNGQVTTV